MHFIHRDEIITKLMLSMLKLDPNNGFHELFLKLKKNQRAYKSNNISGHHDHVAIKITKKSRGHLIFFVTYITYITAVDGFNDINYTSL